MIRVLWHAQGNTPLANIPGIGCIDSPAYDCKGNLRTTAQLSKPTGSTAAIRMKKLAFGALLSACVVSNAFAFGAIAADGYVEHKVPAYGFSVGSASRAQGERTALRYCSQHADKCRVGVWFETCGAYAVPARVYAHGWWATKVRATADALKMCGQNSCEVVVGKCEWHGLRGW